MLSPSLSSALFLFLLLLSCAPLPLSSARRILHEPFFPPEDTPVPPSPSPTPKYPFSSSASTPDPSPFFQSYPSPPPPVPFASFPANISSLQHLPDTTSSSPSILALTASAFSALILAAILAAFCFCRRSPPPDVPGEKTPLAGEKLSSEILYLGTLVNSRGDTGQVPGRRSPELRPLSLGEEEFYSPEAGAVGCSGAGSTSSSPSSGSRARSESASLSPPVSTSPRRSDPKSPVADVAPSEPVVWTAYVINEPYASSSDGSGRYVRSPTLTPAILSAPPQVRHSPTPSVTSSSPERSPETVTAVQEHIAFSSPERISETVTAMVQNVSRNEPPSAPPPPPPPLPPQKLPSPPKIAQLGSKPPPLTPPSRPFMFQNPTKLPPTPIHTSQDTEKIEEETPRPKLKPLHWDKVRASSGRDMVWDHLGSCSFELNEEMIESLFIVNTPQSKPKEATPRSTSPFQDNRVLDPKKSQNIAIALRALNVTVDEVCDALSEGNADTLGAELWEILLKMAPNKEEERKLKDFKDDPSVKLGPAEKFLKAVLDVPFAFRRVDVMFYMANFEAEIGYLNKSFETLEAACDELRSDRMFLKLLEAVLKTGNRMNVGTNRGDAHAFKLDTLLKLVDVKGADGKTTLLHFVVQEIIRTEGARLSDKNEDVKCRKLGLQVVSGLSSELANVKKAASMDSEVLASDVYKLSRGINNIEEILRLNENTIPGETGQRFSESMNKFKKASEEEILRIQARERNALLLVKEITEYFHGNSAREEAHPFRIFMVVRDFLNILERVCKEVGSAHRLSVPINPMMPQPVLVFPEKKHHSSSEDDEEVAS